MSNKGFAGQIRLNAQNLSCIRGEQEVFADVAFQVSGGEALIVRGANGTGKSSLLMCLAGLLPVSGNVSWQKGGKSLTKPEYFELIHFIGHLNAIKNELTLAENLQFWSAMFGGDSTPIADALERANLGGLDTYQAGHLSAGQRHRLSLARLLVTPRPVWLLDEPSSALDQQGDRWVADLIQGQISSGGLAVVATHRHIALGTGANVRTLELGQL